MGVINVQKKLVRVKSTTIPKMSETILVVRAQFFSLEVCRLMFSILLSGIFKTLKLMILFVKFVKT